MPYDSPEQNARDISNLGRQLRVPGPESGALRLRSGLKRPRVVASDCLENAKVPKRQCSKDIRVDAQSPIKRAYERTTAAVRSRFSQLRSQPPVSQPSNPIISESTQQSNPDISSIVFALPIPIKIPPPLSASELSDALAQYYEDKFYQGVADPRLLKRRSYGVPDEEFEIEGQDRNDVFMEISGASAEDLGLCRREELRKRYFEEEAEVMTARNVVLARDQVIGMRLWERGKGRADWPGKLLR